MLNKWFFNVAPSDKKRYSSLSLSTKVVYMKTRDLLDILNEMLNGGEGEWERGGGRSGNGDTLQWASMVSRGSSGFMLKKPNLQFVDWKRCLSYQLFLLFFLQVLPDLWQCQRFLDSIDNGQFHHSIPCSVPDILCSIGSAMQGRIFYLRHDAKAAHLQQDEGFKLECMRTSVWGWHQMPKHEFRHRSRDVRFKQPYRAEDFVPI